MYRLEWTLYLAGQSVVGECECETKTAATNQMRHGAKEALGDRWTLRHELTLRGISSALVGYMDTSDPVIVRSGRTAVTLTKV